MDWSTILLGTFISGLVVAVTGIVKLFGRWRPRGLPEGGAEAIAGIIVAGIALALLIAFAVNPIIDKVTK